MTSENGNSNKSYLHLEQLRLMPALWKLQIELNSIVAVIKIEGAEGEESTSNFITHRTEIKPGRWNNDMKVFIKNAKDILKFNKVAEYKIPDICLELHNTINSSSNYKLFEDVWSSIILKNKRKTNGKRFFTGQDIFGNHGNDNSNNEGEEEEEILSYLKENRLAYCYANKVTKRKRIRQPIIPFSSNLSYRNPEHPTAATYQDYEEIMSCSNDDIYYAYMRLLPLESLKTKIQLVHITIAMAVSALTLTIVILMNFMTSAAGDSFSADNDDDVLTSTFVYYDPNEDCFKSKDYVLDRGAIVLPTPASNVASMHYEFYNLEHLNEFYRRELKDKATTIDTLFEEHFDLIEEFNKHPKYSTSSVGELVYVFSHQDRFNTTPYFDAVGFPGSGKSSLAETTTLISYRGIKLTNPNAAQAIRILGSREPAQYTLIIDEADKIDKDSEFLTVLKDGYTKNGRAQRINTNTFSPEFFPTYCIKFLFSEKIP